MRNYNLPRYAAGPACKHGAGEQHTQKAFDVTFYCRGHDAARSEHNKILFFPFSPKPNKAEFWKIALLSKPMKKMRRLAHATALMQLKTAGKQKWIRPHNLSTSQSGDQSVGRPLVLLLDYKHENYGNYCAGKMIYCHLVDRSCGLFIIWCTSDCYFEKNISACIHSTALYHIACKHEKKCACNCNHCLTEQLGDDTVHL